MDINTRNYSHPSFQANLIGIDEKSVDAISRSLRGHFKKEVHANLDILQSIYPKSVVTLKLNSLEDGFELVAKNTTNGKILTEAVTNQKESGNAFTKLLSRLINKDDKFWS